MLAHLLPGRSGRWQLRDAPPLLLIAATIVAGITVLVWTTRYGLAIHRLNRGVGDTLFLSADGKPWFRLDEHRRDVPIAKIAPILRHAVVAVEDHRFHKHAGVDPLAVGRAVYRNLRAGRMVEGGSTITQQLARSLFLTNRRTWGRKAKEAVLAVMLEQQLTKAQILELYLNRAYLGSGRYGVEAMSQAVFDKPASRVTLAEAALLAGLLKAPSALSPWSNFEAARRRSLVVLSRLEQEGYVTARAASLARAARLRLAPPPGSVEPRAGYPKEFLRAAFRKEFGNEAPPDWRVHTTFLPALQDAAERAVNDGLRRLGRSHLQAALVALDPKTGDLLALVGGRDVNRFPFNRASQALRQPGSAFKPLVYAAALERGMSPLTVLDGLRRVAFQDEAGEEEWSPGGDGQRDDSMTFRQALLESNNAAAVLVQQRAGTGSVRRLADRLGVENQPDVPSLALGTGLTSPLALAAAYAAFPNGGFAVKPRAIVRVLDDDRELAFSQAVSRKRALSEETAFQMVSILRDVVARGTGSPARQWALGPSIGGKTGTTNDFKDAWFVGFSPGVVAAVWVGFDQPAKISDRGYGARVALPIWANFMKVAVRLRPAKAPAPPPTLVSVELCQVSYFRPVDHCPTYVEYLRESDSRPNRLCGLHEGTLKEELKRAVQGLLDKLRRRVFKWLER